MYDRAHALSHQIHRHQFDILVVTAWAGNISLPDQKPVSPDLDLHWV